MIPKEGKNIFKLEKLPTGWKACLLNQAVKINGGSQPPKTSFKSEPEDGYVRLVQIRDYKSDRYRTYVPEKSTKKFCTAEDIMIGRYGPPVFQILRGIAGAYNVALMKTEPLFNLDRDYLFYLLCSLPLQNFVIENSKRTSGQTGVNLKLLNSCIVPLPPLATQKKIAAILDAADEHRTKTAALIDQYTALSQSLFLEMFGDPVKNEKGWEVKELVDLTSKIGSGATPRGGKESYKEEGISLIRSLNIYDNRFKYKKLAFIDDVQAKKLSNVEVQEGDVLFNITGASICRCTIVPNDVLPARVNQHVSILRPKVELLNRHYLNYLLVSGNTKLHLLGIGSSGGAIMEAITKETLQNFKTLLPPIILQNQFAERVQAIEVQKKQAEDTLVKAEELFQSLLQRAFKGELM
ncbi:MAG: restriction endonuclease subunit S [Bacteroidetes bacterium]|nr:MAG: restriction endonuclease subunit S [Bacteroidota bacterium]